MRRLHGRRVVERAVAVEIPGVGERPALGVARAAAVEVDGQRRRPLVGDPVAGGDRRLIRGVGDPPDRAAVEVGVVERAVGADLEVDGIGRRPPNVARLFGSGRPFPPGNMTQMQSRE